MKTFNKELSPREAPCPRCGADAEWDFVDETKEFVEVRCPECRVFQLPRVEFDHAESEIIEPAERRE